jgi:LPS sulfotransferase NodH
VRRIASRLLQLLLPLLNRVLHLAEVTLWSGSGRPLPHAPVLIVGAPRSGSTLLFQVLTEAFDFGYLSNAHCMFSGGPSLVERFARPLRRRASSTFTSRRGVVEGWAAPSECGRFWYRFFRRKPEYVPASAFAPRERRALRSALRALLGAFGRPALFKNMHCGLRLEPLADAVPEALFIFITRDVVDNAHSLLETRRDVYGDYATWWSMEPPEIDALKTLPPEQQVVQQVRSLNALIAKQLQELHRGRFITITYDQLSARPRDVVERVAQFLAAHQAEPPRRNAVPEAFPATAKIRIDAALYERLRAYVTAEPAR